MFYLSLQHFMFYFSLQVFMVGSIKNVVCQEYICV